jgi:hypothetical protein
MLTRVASSNGGVTHLVWWREMPCAHKHPTVCHGDQRHRHDRKSDTERRERLILVGKGSPGITVGGLHACLRQDRFQDADAHRIRAPSSTAPLEAPGIAGDVTGPTTCQAQWSAGHRFQYEHNDIGERHHTIGAGGEL